MSDAFDKQAYCPVCRNHSSFITSIDWDSTSVDGTDYIYPRRKAICARCGSEAVFAPYTEEAGRNFNNAVKKDLSRVPTFVVVDLVRMTGSVESAAAIVGISEEYYMRFMNGLTPSEEHSQRIFNAWQEYKQAD